MTGVRGLNAKVTRRMLLDAAFDLLDSGRDACTVKALSHRLRMSKTTLYRHFLGIDALINAVVEEGCAHTEARLVAVRRARSANERLDLVIGAVAGHGDGLPGCCVLAPGLFSRVSRRRLMTVGQALRRAVSEVIVRGCSEAEFRCTDVRITSVACTAAVLELPVLMALDRTRALDAVHEVGRLVSTALVSTAGDGRLPVVRAWTPRRPPRMRGALPLAGRLPLPTTGRFPTRHGRAVLEAVVDLMDGAGIGPLVVEVAAHTVLSRSGVVYHLRRLAAGGLVHGAVVMGRSRRWTVTTAGRRALVESDST